MGVLLASLAALSAPVGAAPAPDFALKSTAGTNLRLSEYRGEVVMLAFWASWCGQCRSELEVFGELHRRYEGVGFRLLGVNLDAEIGRARATAESLGLAFPVLHDAGGTVGELYDVDDLPLIVLIDREGNLRSVHGGRDGLESDAYTNEVRELLRE